MSLERTGSRGASGDWSWTWGLRMPHIEKDPTTLLNSSNAPPHATVHIMTVVPSIVHGSSYMIMWLNTGQCTDVALDHLSSKKWHGRGYTLSSAMFVNMRFISTIHLRIAQRITQQPPLSLFSNVSKAALVAASNTSSTPCPVKDEHSRYFRAPISRAAFMPSFSVVNFRDFLRISSCAT